MQHIKFGRTGLRVSRLCLGTMTFGLQCDEPQSHSILDKAAEGGIDFLDTADVYPLGGGRATVGRTEEIVGGWLKGKRQNYVVATKCFGQTGPKPWDQGMSRKHILDAIDASLKRLGTDYVDLYQLHGVDPSTPIDEALEALDMVVKAGKARYIGASTMYAWQFAKMNYIADLNGWTRFVNMQCQYSLLYREEEREMMPYCQDDGVAVTTFSPLARGYLTGAADTARTAHDIYLNWFGDEIDQEIARRVREVAARREVTPAHVATAWVAASANVTVPLVGADDPVHLDVAVQALDLGLTEAENDFLTEAYRPRDMINDYNPVRRPRALMRT
jgi:1-deoxyxylulose-5-phosphate synthase